MIKSYTDIKQSQILANILPIESADMSYSIIHNIGQEPYYCNVPTFTYVANGDIPCWSVAALLDVLPLEVSFNKQTDDVDTYYYIASCDTRYCDVYSHRHINVVDACYETIVKLKELNLL